MCLHTCGYPATHTFVYILCLRQMPVRLLIRQLQLHSFIWKRIYRLSTATTSLGHLHPATSTYAYIFGDRADSFLHSCLHQLMMSASCYLGRSTRMSAAWPALYMSTRGPVCCLQCSCLHRAFRAQHARWSSLPTYVYTIPPIYICNGHPASVYNMVTSILSTSTPSVYTTVTSSPVYVCNSLSAIWYNLHLQRLQHRQYGYNFLVFIPTVTGNNSLSTTSASTSSSTSFRLLLCLQPRLLQPVLHSKSVYTSSRTLSTWWFPSRR